MDDKQNEQNHLGPVYWRASAYEGAAADSLLWISEGASDLWMGRPVPQDDASQCLLAMRLLFEQFLECGQQFEANAAVTPAMRVFVERLPVPRAEVGKTVVCLDVQVVGGLAYVSMVTNKVLGPDMKPVLLQHGDGAWQLFTRLLAYL